MQNTTINRSRQHHGYNNFDLIRLFAALQVAITHMGSHFGIESIAINILGLFPGVPIFFFISGYLIYGSYEQSRTSQNVNFNFFTKRFLRLYPALWMCFALSAISIWATGYFTTVDFSTLDIIIWAAAQNSAFQFYNPDFLRNYGIGVINGSLWTISVEIQFYALMPFIFHMLAKSRTSLIIFILLLLISINVLNSNLNERINVYQKLIHVSFLPWLYMFILGGLAHKYDHALRAIKRTPILLLLGIYIVSYFLTKNYGWGNSINPISYFILIGLIIKIAHTKPEISYRTIGNNDISYGIYIFHMPIVNLLIYLEFKADAAFVIATIATLFLSISSWLLVEKKFLALKKSALRKI